MLRVNMIDDTKMSHPRLLVIISAASCHELHIAKSVSYIARQKADDAGGLPTTLRSR
jgi:hypothetical protein